MLSAGVPAPWLVSARSRAALRGQAGRLHEWAMARPGLEPADAAWSLAVSRPALEHRAVITGTGRGELLAGLAALASGTDSPAVTAGVAAGAAGKSVLVFPGQGGQYPRMGRELAACSPVFASRLAECGRALAPFTGWSLDDVLAGAGDGLDRVEVVQPALWAVMVSLAAAWRAAGTRADAVAGHSQGEIAAATVAGVLSLEDGARVVALRSRALAALAGQGAMVAVAAGEQETAQLLQGLPGLAVAAVNSPAATVVSGDPEQAGALLAACQRAGVRARQVPVGYASHSPQVEAIRDQLADALEGITPRAGDIPMVSALTGQILDGATAGAGYWYANLRGQVRFAGAVTVLAGLGYRAFIEASPHPVLTAAVTETLDTAGITPGEAVVTGTLHRDRPGAGEFLAALARVHAHGTQVDWAAVLAGQGGRRVDLPTYAFQRTRYWLAAGPGGGGRGPGAGRFGGGGAVLGRGRGPGPRPGRGGPGGGRG